MAETDECAQRACLRMAEVTVMHSVVTSATGLRAIGREEGACVGVGVDIVVEDSSVTICEGEEFREEKDCKDQARVCVFHSLPLSLSHSLSHTLSRTRELSLTRLAE